MKEGGKKEGEENEMEQSLISMTSYVSGNEAAADFTAVSY